MNNPGSKSYIDIHCHVVRLEKSVFSLPSLFVNELSMDVEFDQPVSVGLHPWHIKDVDVIEQLSMVEALSGNEKVLAIGECGLDRNISVLIDKQIDVFKRQIEIANDYKKPLIIHNVKAFSDIMHILKSENIETPWILHGFNANKIITKKLLDFDIYFSFGEAILKDNSKAGEVLTEIPLDRIFFETDESEYSIIDIYEKASEILNIDIEVIKQQVYKNYLNLFVD